MSTQLFYFSGTGNSLELARDIAKNLDNTELVSIPTVSAETININADTVGFVFPVYAWGVPVCPKTAKAAGKFHVFRNVRRPAYYECLLSRQVRGRRIAAGALQLDE